MKWDPDDMSVLTAKTVCTPQLTSIYQRLELDHSAIPL